MDYNVLTDPTPLHVIVEDGELAAMVSKPRTPKEEWLLELLKVADGITGSLFDGDYHFNAYTGHRNRLSITMNNINN